MASLTFFGGVNEIGGNKILIEDKKTRIFLDFGQSFSLLDDYFVEWLQPRTSRFGLRDYFALGLMPPLKGLYEKSALAYSSIKYQKPLYDAVFISHPHFDHTAHLQFLDPAIPLYMGETCEKILDSNQSTTTSFFFSKEEKKEKNDSITQKNELHTFRTGQKISIDSLTITPIHVDHSVPGSYGFLVETSQGAIAYTGDLRAHGNKPQLTHDFLSKAASFEPELLIIEGTRVSEHENRKNHSETTVKTSSTDVVSSATGLCLAMRYPKDLDRFRSFYEISKKIGKTLVISLKTAHLLLSLSSDTSLALPNPVSDKNILVYAREMKTYKKWEKELFELLSSKCIDSSYVSKHQKELIWELDFNQMTELIDVAPSGGACIHSMSEPFEEDPISQLQDSVLKNWLSRFSMPYYQLHASGHSSKEEIFSMISLINPKKVAPVHTHHAEMFPSHLRMEKGRKVEI